MCFAEKKSGKVTGSSGTVYGPYVRYVSVEKQRSFAMHVAKVKHFFPDRLVVETIISISVMKKQQT